LGILGTCSGASKDAVSVQTGKLVKSFDIEQRTEMIKNAQITLWSQWKWTWEFHGKNWKQCLGKLKTFLYFMLLP